MSEPIFISAYFSLDRDLHKNVQLESDDFSYIKSYYKSIVRNDLSSVIITDSISQEFVERYRNRNVDFHIIKCFPSIDHLLLHDKRFFYYLYLMSMKVDQEYFLFSDVSDVIVLNPVTKIMTLDPKVLYVNHENDNILNNIWFNQYLIDLEWPGEEEEKLRKLFRGKQILNCGVIMGHRDLLMNVLIDMVQFMISSYNRYNIKKPLDMLAINYVVYTQYEDILYTGDRFHTKFGHNHYDNDKVIKHK